MRFAVFTHVPHISHKSRFYAYGPYVREMNLWFENVEEIEIIAPLTKNTIPGNILLPYKYSNIKFTEVSSFNLLTVKEGFKALVNLPIIISKVFFAMKRADHIHLRCPGNMGLVSCFVQIFFPKKPKTVKYAGNWDPESKQPWTYKLQKAILKNTLLTRNMKVLVYGDWKDQSANIVPFFTASFSEDQKESIHKEFQKPYSFIFTGGLVEGKRPLFAIKLMEALIREQIPVKLAMYGNGELFEFLQNYIKTNNLEPFVSLFGNQKQEVLIEAYKNAHFAILPSKSEGWPKAIAEAMFFGCIPIATAVSCVPWMLGFGSRGILIPGGREERGLLDTFQKNRQFEYFPKTAETVSENVSRTGFTETLEVTKSEDRVGGTVGKIVELINNPEEMRRMSLQTQEWSQQYTLEKFEEGIKQFL